MNDEERERMTKKKNQKDNKQQKEGMANDKKRNYKDNE
jgi:hypothetical protein